MGVFSLSAHTSPPPTVLIYIHTKNISAYLWKIESFGRKSREERAAGVSSHCQGKLDAFKKCASLCMYGSSAPARSEWKAWKLATLLSVSSYHGPIHTCIYIIYVVGRAHLFSNFLTNRQTQSTRKEDTKKKVFHLPLLLLH